MIIRQAKEEDAKELLAIYAPYVQKTAITFECEVPSVKEFEKRIRETLKKYPYLVVEEDGIQGYAYAGVFKDRAAYERSCELSVYVKEESRKKGYGRALYTALEKELKDRNFLNLYACIASPIRIDDTLDNNSEEFHRHLGFETVGRFHSCGYKFGRWYDMIWMEKMIGEHQNGNGEENI